MVLPSFFFGWINKDFPHVQGRECASEVPNLVDLGLSAQVMIFRRWWQY